MTEFNDLPVFSPAAPERPAAAAAHPTCNHALVADLFDDEG